MGFECEILMILMNPLDIWSDVSIEILLVDHGRLLKNEHDFGHEVALVRQRYQVSAHIGQGSISGQNMTLNGATRHRRERVHCGKQGTHPSPRCTHTKTGVDLSHCCRGRRIQCPRQNARVDNELGFKHVGGESGNRIINQSNTHKGHAHVHGEGVVCAWWSIAAQHNCCFAHTKGQG